MHNKRLGPQTPRLGDLLSVDRLALDWSCPPGNGGAGAEGGGVV